MEKHGPVRGERGIQSRRKFHAIVLFDRVSLRAASKQAKKKFADSPANNGRWKSCVERKQKTKAGRERKKGREGNKAGSKRIKISATPQIPGRFFAGKTRGKSEGGSTLCLVFAGNSRFTLHNAITCLERAWPACTNETGNKRIGRRVFFFLSLSFFLFAPDKNEKTRVDGGRSSKDTRKP